MIRMAAQRGMRRLSRLTSGSSGQLSVSVLVPDQDAGLVADLASGNSLAITLLPADTEPVVDLVRE